SELDELRGRLRTRPLGRRVCRQRDALPRPRPRLSSAGRDPRLAPGTRRKRQAGAAVECRARLRGAGGDGLPLQARRQGRDDPRQPQPHPQGPAQRERQQMSTFLIGFISLAFVLGTFAYVAMPAGSRLRRGLVSGLFALILGAVFFGYSDMLGRPKSTRLEVL